MAAHQTVYEDVIWMDETNRRASPYIALVRKDGTEHDHRIAWLGARFNAEEMAITGSSVRFDSHTWPQSDPSTFVAWRIYSRSGRLLHETALPKPLSFKDGSILFEAQELRVDLSTLLLPQEIS